MNRLILLVSTLILSCFLMLQYATVNAQLTIAISTNNIQLYNGDNITLTTANLNSVINGVSDNRYIYTVTSVSEGRFLKFNSTLGVYVPTNTFTVGDVVNGLVIFSHNGNQEIPSYTLLAFDPLFGITSAPSTVVVTFTAFRRGTIGAPRPGFFASVDPTTLMVTLRIRMFKRVFDLPEVSFNIGLSSQMACQQTDLIRDGFALSSMTSWYNDYVLVLSLADYLRNINVQQVSNGGVIDLVTYMFADYMITRYTPLSSSANTGGDIYVAPPISGTCYQVIYQQKYILTLALQVTRVNFNNSNPTSFLQPKKIFVNDLGKLEIRLIVWTTVAPPISSWSISGPFYFNVTDATYIGTSNGYYLYQLVLQSNVINGPIDFYGDYVLSFVSSGGTNTIPYSLQYLVPYPPITQVLQYNTTAQTFGNAALTVPKTQFQPTDTVYIRVDAPGAPSLPFLAISPYNVILCCFLDFATIPVNVDCRNASRADFSDEIFVNGQAERAGGVDADTLPPPTTSSYGFQFNFPLAIRDNLDRRCFLTIESAYLGSNTTLRAIAKEDKYGAETRSIKANPVANSVVSITYRLFDIIPISKTGTGQTSAATNIYGWNMLIICSALISFFLM